MSVVDVTADDPPPSAQPSAPNSKKKSMHWGTGADAEEVYTKEMLTLLNQKIEPPCCVPKGKGITKAWTEFAAEVKQLNMFTRDGYTRLDADNLRDYPRLDISRSL